MNIHSYVLQPIAATSSLAYILCGYFIWRSVKVKSSKLKQFVYISAIMGITSFIAHSNYSVISIAMDYASIIMIISFFALDDFLLKRLDTTLKLMISLSAVYGFYMLVYYKFVASFQISLTFLIFILAFLHVIKVKGLGPFKEKEFVISMLLFGLSFLFFLFDKSDVLCKITWLPYGHSIWHLGTALSLYIYSQWMFREVKTP